MEAGVEGDVPGTADSCDSASRRRLVRERGVADIGQIETMGGRRPGILGAEERKRRRMMEGCWCFFYLKALMVDEEIIT
jgi:hypothetical protein